MSDERPPFERTVCACKDCVQCCKQHPAHLIPSDLPRIARHLGVDLQGLGKHLRKSPGAMVAGRFGVGFIGTVIPAPDKTGRCTFLMDDDRCAIHEVAPFGCAYFDTHQPIEESQRRSLWGLRLIDESTEYKAFRATLEPTASYKPRP